MASKDPLLVCLCITLLLSPSFFEATAFSCFVVHMDRARVTPFILRPAYEHTTDPDISTERSSDCSRSRLLPLI
jgi:hypothetical protein